MPHGDALEEDAKQQTSDLFDDWAEHYATERERTPYFQAQMAIALSMLAGETGRVLDIGCAGGGEITELRKRGFAVVGIDLSPRMLVFARRRFAGDAGSHFCRADVERLPFSTQSMDHVVCLGVFEFLQDYQAAILEIHRVMRPGGVVMFAIPSRISLYNLTDRLVSNTAGPLWRMAKRLLGRKPAVPAAPPLERNLVVPWRFQALLRQHGFAPERNRSSNFFIYPLDRFPELNMRVAAALEPLCSVPGLRWAASVYLVSARKK
ncbi:MAG TPA: class I SAM-dependent methyltransferase [Bryobacteraceae bacterium]|jgi:SAM-dependent methyltransferase